MTKIVTVLLALNFFIFCGVATASEKNDCYTEFYKTKDMSCVDRYLDVMPTNAVKLPNDGFLHYQSASGFLAEIFLTYPQKKESILNKKSSDGAKKIYFEALYAAGLTEEAKQYADANGFIEVFNKYKNQNLGGIKQLKPSFYAGDNDLLIAAYMASGDENYIKNILDNFTSAEDGMVSDAFRIGFMKSKFGSNLTPNGRKNIMAQTACERYKCKSNPRDFMRLLTLSSGFWAIQSLSQKDEVIKKISADFFNKDKRLYKLLGAEVVGFSNYLTILPVSMAIKDPMTDKALTVYEMLGSAKEFNEAMHMQKKE